MAQHLMYGTNILASDLAPQLEAYDRNQQGVNSWRQLFGNASLQNMAAQDTLKTDYASAAAEAYKAYQKQKNDTLAARLAPGATTDIAAQANRDFINSAYSQYVSKYMEDANKIAEDYSKTVTGINENLTGRAENYASLYRSAYDYLSSELAGATKTANGVTSTWMADNALGDFLLENGEIRTWNDISRKLFDDNRNLTTLGKRYYDVILNSIPDEYMTDKGSAARSFDEWLAATNPKLRDWYVSADAFGEGSAAGGVKSAIGIGDRPYSAKEYADFTDYVTAASKVFDVDKRGSTAYNAIDDLDKLAKDIEGYERKEGSLIADMRKEFGYYTVDGKPIDWTEAEQKVKEYKAELTADYNKAAGEYRNYIKQYYDDIATQLKSTDYESFVKANASLVKDIESVLNKEVNSVKDLENLTRNMQKLYTALGKFSSSAVGSGIKAKMETPPSIGRFDNRGLWRTDEEYAADKARKEDQIKDAAYNRAIKNASTGGSRSRSNGIITRLLRRILGND